MRCDCCSCRACKECESPIEKLLFHAFIDLGLLPILQFRIGKYRVDFLFYEEKLIVEADGKRYHSSIFSRMRDRRRDRYLKRKGYRVIRFTGSQIFRNASLCARRVKKLLR